GGGVGVRSVGGRRNGGWRGARRERLGGRRTGGPPRGAAGAGGERWGLDGGPGPATNVRSKRIRAPPPVLTARCGLRQGRAMKASVGVLGNGSWGTALAIHLARTGHPVALWGRNAEMVARLRAAGEHSTCHPGVRFPEELFPTADLEAACTASDAIVVSCPSHAVRTLGELIRPMLARDTLIVSTSKGIEQDTHLTMSGILEAVL